MRWGDKGSPFVAEIGGNHGGDPSLAAVMVKAAAKSGFGGVKFQAYRTESFLHESSPYFAELKREELSFDDLARLSDLARGLTLSFGLTAFDPDGLALAASLACDYAKISSGDINHYPLLRRAAESKLPLVVSAGAATEAEVENALRLTANRAMVLQCASLYPTPESAINLSVMVAWLKRGLKAGLSDHSLATESMKWAYLLGAHMIEKHFTVDRNLPGGDNDMSLDPASMGRLMDELKRLSERGNGPCLTQNETGEAYLPPAMAHGPTAMEELEGKPFWGNPIKRPQAGENPGLIRRYALASNDIQKGEKISLERIAFKRLSPQLIGRGAVLTPDRDIAGLKAKTIIRQNEPVYLSALDT